jgi:hypothetical protein
MKLNLLLLSAAALFHAATATRGTEPDTQEVVDLGDAGDYVIFTEAGISTVPDSAITGDIAVYPAAATYMTGFGLNLAAGDDFSTSPQFAGFKAWARGYSGDVAIKLSSAANHTFFAYEEAEGRENNPAVPDRTNPGKNSAGVVSEGGDISGMTLTPGVYTFTVDIAINSAITLSGAADSVYIIKTTKSLKQAENTQVNLGAVLPQNVFWQVAERVVVGKSSTLKGIVLVKNDALFKTKSTLIGRVYAQKTCDLQKTTVTQP